MLIAKRRQIYLKNGSKGCEEHNDSKLAIRR